jgi:hypothetical protein
MAQPAFNACFGSFASFLLPDSSPNNGHQPPAGLKDDAQRKVSLRSVVVVAQKGLGGAPDGVAECEPHVLTFPTR